MTDTLESLRAEVASLRAELAALKARRQPKGDHQQLVSDWCAYYQRRTKSQYPFGPRDARAAKQLLQHFGSLEAVKDFIKDCHRRAPEYPFGNCETLYDIANGIARLKAALALPPKATRTNGHRQPAPRPHVTLV